MNLGKVWITLTTLMEARDERVNFSIWFKHFKHFVKSGSFELICVPMVETYIRDKPICDSHTVRSHSEKCTFLI